MGRPLFRVPCVASQSTGGAIRSLILLLLLLAAAAALSLSTWRSPRRKSVTLDAAQPNAPNKIANLFFLGRGRRRYSGAASAALAAGTAVSVVKQLTLPLTCINNILKLIPAGRTVSQDLVVVPVEK